MRYRHNINIIYGHHIPQPQPLRYPVRKGPYPDPTKLPAPTSHIIPLAYTSSRTTSPFQPPRRSPAHPAPPPLPIPTLPRPHLYFLLLPNPVRAIHRLQVHLRIPVRIIQHHDICRRKVDPQTARARGQQKHKPFRAFAVKLVDRELAVHARGVAVDAAVLVTAVDAVVLQNIDDTRHLRKNKNPRAALLELHQ